VEPFARLQISADVDIGRIAEPTDPVSSPEPETLRIRGRVTNARTGGPLEGLLVSALTTAKAGCSIGSSRTRADGTFEILPEDSVETREYLAVARTLPEPRVYLLVENTKGDNLAATPPFALDRADVQRDIAVQLPPADVTSREWQTLAHVLETTRAARLNDAIALLRSGGAGLDAIPMLARETMLEKVERAFLDPTGLLQRAVGFTPTLHQMHDEEFAAGYAKRLQSSLGDPPTATAYADLISRATSFHSIDAVDWVMQPDALRESDLRTAVNRYSEYYKYGKSFDFIAGWKGNLIRYRDYLLDIWISLAQRIEYVQGRVLTAAEALEQISNRFHQDFRTVDDTLTAANPIAAAILARVLAAPANQAGFDLPPASIPPPGAGTPRGYLDQLIALTGWSARELGLRYRLDFARPDSAKSSPVQENIAALQGFFRDSFQCGPEPFHVPPDRHDQPIIPDILQGNAPFFLYYDEWLRQQAPFYAENHLDVRRMLESGVSHVPSRNLLNELAAGRVPGQGANVPLWRMCHKVVAIWDKLQEGHGHYYNGEFALARRDYAVAAEIARSAMQENVLPNAVPTGLVNQRKNLPLKSMKDVPAFHNPPGMQAGGFSYPLSPDWARERMGLRLAYYALITIPVCLGDAELALGDYEQAVFHYGQSTRFLVAVARESDSGGYRPHYLGKFGMYYKGDKPYSVALVKGSRDAAGFHPYGPAGPPYPVEQSEERYNEYYDTSTYNPVEMFAAQWARRLPHAAEAKLLRLKQAAAMLEWADALFRVNESTSKARARELYKGVLWLHRHSPQTCPNWPENFSVGMLPIYLHHAENPALLSQLDRAKLAIYQIDNGLNYYGESDNVVPILRYRPLKDTADRMAVMARGAQQDFINYTQQVEAAIVARLQLANFLQKAQLQTSIADEATAIAHHDVKVAKDQVAAVQAAIQAKKDEIAEADSLFGQVGEAFKSIKGMIGDLDEDTKSAVSAAVKSEVTGEALVGKGMLGLGAPASIMAGFGIFVAVGTITLNNMAKAANQRLADLRTLTDKALPAAEAVVAAREHGVNITRLQRQIAQADADLARTLLAFEQDRTLNLHFWNELARVARRLLRRYLEMGARVSWLAERALSYEQDRPLRIVRMDYYPARLQGVTGADLMMADLAELEATRVEGIKRAVPVRRTLSLARDFPLQYGQLKQTGRCAFRTEESLFRAAHPGTGSYRIRAVSATVQQVNLTVPLRGSLINFGVSISKPGQPDEHVLVRPADSLPISEFRIEQHMALYGLPGETLLSFEGTFAESFWELSFPPEANPAGLDGLADVLLTFDLFAEFAPERYGADLAAAPAKTRKWILVSAARFDAPAIAGLAGAAPAVNIDYDIAGNRVLPRRETGRKIHNVALLAVARGELDFQARLTAATVSASVAFDNGFAISSLQPDPALPVLPASPLNAFAGLDPEQRFTLTVNKASNPGVDFSRVTDVILALEYEASTA
jgi:hypothetical protein